MLRTYILNDKEVEKYNEIYNTTLTNIMIKQAGDKYYAILDCDIKKRINDIEIVLNNLI